MFGLKVKRRSWRDLGQKSGLVAESPRLSNNVYYPTLYLGSKQIGTLDVTVGDEVVLIAKASITSMSMNEKGVANYTFELKKMKVMPSNEKYDDIGDED